MRGVNVDFQKYNKIMDQTLYKKKGRVVNVVGLTIESAGPDAKLGDICEILSEGEERHAIPAEVVGFKDRKTLLMPYGSVEGIGAGCLVENTGLPLQVAVGDGLLGRTLDGLGHPLDGSQFEGVSYMVEAMPPDPLSRKLIDEVLPLGVKAVDGLITVGKGQRIGIFAGSGVGKSTLMKLIFKVCKPDSGTIRLFGKELESYPTKKLYHLIGLVFQNPENQFITNTVWDEMMFSLKRTRESREEKERRIKGMLEQFHLEEEKEKSPFVLSQGQKRRLSVASMLLTNQEILFLDEPTYGQDFENRQELMKDMQELVEKGITIVMITHDLSLVRQYATHVVEIENGSVVKSLPTGEYFAWRGERTDNVCLY